MLEGSWTTLDRTRPLERTWFDAFVLAVAEVATNIIQYAYQPEAIDPQFVLSVVCHPYRLTALRVDWGGVAPDPDEGAVMPEDSSDIAQISTLGRGLAIIRLTTDRFEYWRTDDGENSWHIEKLFPAA
jgi:anti-sigma regulatory factor (Ser/Thr protein kinase)